MPIHSISLGYFNDDSHIDIMLLNFNREMKLLINSVYGYWTSIEKYNYSTNTTSLTGGNINIRSTLGDINDDGRIDIVVVNNGQDYQLLLINSVDGTFSDTSLVSLPVCSMDISYPITVGDANGDGHIDIMIDNNNLAN